MLKYLAILYMAAQGRERVSCACPLREAGGRIYFQAAGIHCTRLVQSRMTSIMIGCDVCITKRWARKKGRGGEERRTTRHEESESTYRQEAHIHMMDRYIHSSVQTRKDGGRAGFRKVSLKSAGGGGDGCRRACRRRVRTGGNPFPLPNPPLRL